MKHWLAFPQYPVPVTTWRRCPDIAPCGYKFGLPVKLRDVEPKDPQLPKEG